jgi:hypothetical protein
MTGPLSGSVRLVLALRINYINWLWKVTKDRVPLFSEWIALRKVKEIPLVNVADIRPTLWEDCLRRDLRPVPQNGSERRSAGHG